MNHPCILRLDFSRAKPQTPVMKTTAPQPLESIPTPALVVDAMVTRRNIDRLAGYGAQHGIAIRPHTKTHKSRMVAQLQLQAGARGLTVAKAGEAEEMAPVC